MIHSVLGTTSIDDPRPCCRPFPTIRPLYPRAPFTRTADPVENRHPGVDYPPDALRALSKRAKVPLWKPGTNPAGRARLTQRKDGETNGRDT